MLKHLAKLLMASAISFIAHLAVLHFLGLSLLAHKIILSYLANTILAIIILILLLKAQKRFQNSLGFLFMGSSFLKFGLFFTLFYPTYYLDKDVDKQEFLTFFVPYGTCLIFETKILISQNFSNKKGSFQKSLKEIRSFLW